MKKSVLLWACLLTQISLAQAPLPAPPVGAWLEKAGLSASNAGVYIAPIGNGQATFSLNAQQPFNPASVMKLYTTFAGLEILGPAHVWKTQLLSNAAPEKGVIAGDVVIKGGGDPSLKLQDAWRLLHELKLQGVKTIQGHFVLDSSVFGGEAFDAAFDGEGARAYNAAPDGLLVSFNATRITFTPDAAGGAWVVGADMLPEGVKLQGAVQAVRGGCGDWRGKLQLSIAQGAVTVGGSIPLSCGAQSIYRSLGSPQTHAGSVFVQLWREMGGAVSGFKLGAAGVGAGNKANLLAEIESQPLAEIIRDINKRSNNVMARSLFLSLAQTSGAKPTDGQSTMRQWLAQRGLSSDAFVVENGSGLSRIERSSAAHLAQLLQAAFQSGVMPEFMSSFAVLGQDGTVRNKANKSEGVAHLKTGTLRDVRSLAGYVQAASGRRYVFVVLLNASNAGAGQGVIDNVLQWVLQKG